MTVVLGFLSTLVFVYSYEYWYYNIDKNHAMGYEFQGGLAAMAGITIFIFVFLTSCIMTLFILIMLQGLKKVEYNSGLHYFIYSIITIIFGIILMIRSFDIFLLFAILTPATFFIVCKFLMNAQSMILNRNNRK